VTATLHECVKQLVCACFVCGGGEGWGGRGLGVLGVLVCDACVRCGVWVSVCVFVRVCVGECMCVISVLGCDVFMCLCA
jgi:hypothetical protein